MSSPETKDSDRERMIAEARMIREGWCPPEAPTPPKQPKATGCAQGCGWIALIAFAGTVLVAGLTYLVESLDRNQQQRPEAVEAPMGRPSTSAVTQTLEPLVNPDCSSYRAGRIDEVYREGGVWTLWHCLSDEAAELAAMHNRLLETDWENAPPRCVDLYDWLGRFDTFEAHLRAVVPYAEQEPVRGFLRETLGYDLANRMRGLIDTETRAARQQFQYALNELCAAP